MTELNSLQVVFDNGGGVTLQTCAYAHYYDDAADAARDYSVLAETGSTAGWEGNDAEARIDATDDSSGGYRVLGADDVARIVAAGAPAGAWNNVRAFVRALGVPVTD